MHSHGRSHACGKQRSFPQRSYHRDHWHTVPQCKAATALTQVLPASIECCCRPILAGQTRVRRLQYLDSPSSDSRRTRSLPWLLTLLPRRLCCALLSAAGIPSQSVAIRCSVVSCPNLSCRGSAIWASLGSRYCWLTRPDLSPARVNRHCAKAPGAANAACRLLLGPLLDSWCTATGTARARQSSR